MDLEDIKYQLAKKGISFVGLDRKYGLSRGICRIAVSSPHAKGEQVIADALGMKPQDVFPNRYDEYGNRLKPQPKAEYLYTPKYLKGDSNSNA